MNIGIDIDDTICDTMKDIIPKICEYYNLDRLEFENNLTKDNTIISKLAYYKEFAKKYYPEVIPNLKVYEDAKKIIKKLKQNNKIIFITARNTLGKEWSYKVSYDFLTKNDIPLDKLVVGALSKKEICERENINVFIDNSINNCLDVLKCNNVDVLLYDTKYNKYCNNLQRVRSWQEIDDFITSKKI